MSENHKSDSQNNNGFENAAGVETRNGVIKRHRSRPETWYRWLFRQLCLPEQGCILELGSGPGDLWAENREQIPKDWRIFVTDLSAGMVREGVQRLHEQPAGEQFYFAVSDTGRLPFGNQRWDAVLAFGLLDLVEDVAAVLGEIQRALKPNGKFYTSAGGRNHLIELEALLSPFLPNLKFGGHPERFGLENGAELLAPHFENITLTRYYDELVFTTVEPIMDFILSENEVSEQLSEDNQLLLARCLGELLKNRGEIRITAEKGCLGARKWDNDR